MARALAHIEKIHNITPIEGADFIELVHVLGWQCIFSICANALAIILFSFHYILPSMSINFLAATN